MGGLKLGWGTCERAAEVNSSFLKSSPPFLLHGTLPRGRPALGVLRVCLIPAGAGVKRGEATRVGTSTAGSRRSPSLMMAGPCVLSSHSHLCQHPSELSLDRKLPGVDIT